MSNPGQFRAFTYLKKLPADRLQSAGGFFIRADTAQKRIRQLRFIRETCPRKGEICILCYNERKGRMPKGFFGTGSSDISRFEEGKEPVYML